MADVTLVLWRDIPAQIIVKRGRTSARRELPARFMNAVDICAMRSGAHESGAYLVEWRRERFVVDTDDLEAEADRAVAVVEEHFPSDRLAALARAGGWFSALDNENPLTPTLFAVPTATAAPSFHEELVSSHPVTGEPSGANS